MTNVSRGHPPPVVYVPRPSPWLLWHDYLFRPGARVLDLACGEGRHALTAAMWGCTVTAIDRDETKLETAREAARRLGVSVNWLCADLEDAWPELDVFDAVLAFNYLDRARMAQVLDRVATGGLLIMETFLEGQIAYGWGPTSAAHLLRPGELGTMVAPLEILHGREAIEPLDAGRERLVASVVAERRKIS